MTEDYNTNPALSPSAIRAAILRRGPTVEESVISMAHMRAAHLSDRTDEPTPAQLWGILCHAAVLTPHDLAVLPGKTKASREWKAAKSDHEFAVAQGLERPAHLVTTAQMDKLNRVVEAVLKNAEAAQILSRCTIRERPIYWTDGVPMKGRPDMAGAGIVADLKMMKGPTDDEIRSAVYKGGIDIQLAEYGYGLVVQPDGVPTEVHAVICVESAPPHCVAVKYIPIEIIGRALEFSAEVVRIYRAHVLSGSYPGPTAAQSIYEPPHWANDGLDEGPPADMPEGDVGEL